jgi:hypothetical protein
LFGFFGDNKKWECHITSFFIRSGPQQFVGTLPSEIQVEGGLDSSSEGLS